MIKKKGVILLTGISFLFSLTVSEIKNNNHEHFHYHFDNQIMSQNKKYSEPNVSKFNAPDGEHSIYWAQGIETPKMTMKDEEFGKPGFFDREVEVNGAVTYLAQMEPNKGYYDLNKNSSRMGSNRIGDESKHCYLNTASNITLWWLNQNKDLIEIYKERLKETNPSKAIYGQVDGLASVYPYNESTWNNIQKEPGVANIGNHDRQESGLTPFVTEIMKPYYNRYFDGFITDLPLDFFFNGYASRADYELEDILPPNNFEEFHKDPKGGYFFNIFENNILTERYMEPEHKNFSWLNTNLKKFLSEGKAVALSYLFASGSLAHAITVWGAEYDSNDNLTRLYVTDSDDVDNLVNNKPGYTRGLHSMNTKKLDNGKMIIGNNPGPTDGVKIQSIITLDLARDKFEARINDISAPVAPTITKTSEDRIYGLNGHYEISVEANVKDTGTLAYQWYEATSLEDKGSKIIGETKNTFNIPTKEIGVKYYYCEVINQKNGKTTSTNSRYFKADVQNIELVHAETPYIGFDYNTKTISQYSKPLKLDAKASISDEGNLTYQWYQANDNTAANGRLLKGETSRYFYPPTNNPGNFYYYVEVTNTNENPRITGNRKVSARSRLSKRIVVKEDTLFDAMPALIMEQPLDATYELSEEIKPLEVKAKAYDGGTLSYQWNEIIDGVEVPIVGENLNTFTPKISEPGVKQYSCSITNTNLKASQNTIKTISTRYVTITINGEINLSDDNKLTSLEILNGTISPNFDALLNTYNVNVAHNITKLELNATANSKAQVNIINPNLELNKVTQVKIEVVAENGDKNIYTLNVTRDNTHQFGDWEIIKEPTCKETGLRRKTCSGCDEVIEEVIEKLEHQWGEWVVTKPSTETEHGIETRTCKVCGEIETRELELLPHTHKWSEWEIVKEPTTSEEGLERRVCECGEVETRVIPKLEEPIIPEVTNKPKTNVPAIIAGVTIPLSLIILGGVAYFFIKKKH